MRKRATAQGVHPGSVPPPHRAGPAEAGLEGWRSRGAVAMHRPGRPGTEKKLKAVRDNQPRTAP